MDHYHPRENPVNSFGRIAVMVLVSLLTLTIGGGGYTDLNAFGFVAILLVMFWGLPLIVLITLFHFLDKRFGPYARYPIIDRALAFALSYISAREATSST